MKNLKKILIALAVVALLVSSLALIVGADEYTGELKKLYDYYNKVDSTATAENQATALAEAYKYLAGNPVDPESTHDVKVNDGETTTTVTYTYDQVVEMMNTKSVEIGELLYTAVTTAADASAKLNAVSALYNHIAACPAEGATGYAELVAKADVKNVEIVTEQYTIATTKTEIADKKSAAVTICGHIAKYPIDATANADLIANIKAYALGVAEQIYADWTTIPATHAEAGANADGKCSYCGGDMDSVDSAHYFARYNGIYTAKYYLASVSFLVNGKAAAGLNAAESKVTSDILAGCVTMDSEMIDRQIALDSQAAFDDYDLGKPYLTYDCESSLMTSYNANTECYSHAAVDVYGNKYQNFHYGSPAVHCYCEPSPGNKNAYQLGMVIEWDQLFNDTFTGTEFVCRHPSVSMTTAFTISGKDGVLTVNNNKAPNSKVDVESVSATGVVVPNVWAHFTLTYDHETRLGKLYINYEYVCDIEYSDVATFQFVGFRMGKSVTNQEHGYDNWSAMNGSTYRIWDKFEKMSETEKFTYYVNYMVNEDNPSLSRNSAYNRAKLLYATIKGNPSYSSTCADALAAYDACNYDADIKKPAMAENLGILTGMVDELLAMPVTSNNTAAVNTAITEINEFVSVNGELINKGDTSEGGYQSLMMQVNTVKANLVKIENIIAFVNALKKFDRATTYTSMSKYAETAKAIYAIAGYDVADNVAFIENDPVVVSFEEKYNNGDLKSTDEGYISPDSDEYVTIFEYYEMAAEKVAVRYLYENAKRIISCMNFVTSMEGYEATVEFWTKNADYISSYVNIAREIVVSGSYDATVAGLDEAIATFRALDVCFYELLQQQHIEVIAAQLAKYVETEVYIDKVGVCAVVEQYLAENDIAVYNTNMTPEVAAAVADEVATLEELIIVYGVYKDELTAQEADYEAVLAQNTQYFINTVNYMTTVLTYAELKPMFDKATGYYYSIDVNSEEAAAAADKYIAYREQLETLEINGAIFVGYVEGLYAAEMLTGVEREDAIYAALVNCIAYVDLVDEGVEGVAAAMADYEEALAAYNAELDVVNSDITESAKITCAVRTGTISNVVLAIVSKIFED